MLSMEKVSLILHKVSARDPRHVVSGVQSPTYHDMSRRETGLVEKSAKVN